MTRSVLTPKTLIFRTLTHNGGENRVFCALFPNGVKLRRCTLSWSPFSFVSQSSSSGNPSLHGSMSSSADFSDEDDYSVKSGSASPAPGDTLPWNLPRHERSKRKIHGGSVLDPAERAVLRIAGETQSSCYIIRCSTVSRKTSLYVICGDCVCFWYTWFYVGSEQKQVVGMWICGICDGILVCSISGYVKSCLLDM